MKQTIEKIENIVLDSVMNVSMDSAITAIHTSMIIKQALEEGVRELEWKKTKYGYQTLAYTIKEFEDDEEGFYIVSEIEEHDLYFRKLNKDFDALDEAKAAAQNHFKQETLNRFK